MSKSTKASAPARGMTIGYDGKRAVCNNTGLGNYSRYTIDALSVAYPQNTYRLYAPRPQLSERLAPLLGRPNVELVGPDSAIDRRMGWLWRTVDLPLQLRPEDVALYHGLSNEIPLTSARAGIPSVVTIHDLIFRRCPGDYSAFDRRIYDFKYSRSARTATRVIAISERTKADMVELWGIDPDKISVIYQGIDPAFTAPVPLENRRHILAELGLTGKYILSVGTVEPRKNQLLALRALQELPRTVKLVIVGRFRGDYGKRVEAEISRLGLADRVVRPSRPLTVAELAALYAEAAFSSYTSRYEGFGLPVVESLSQHTPVIACTGSCLEEAGGPGAIYVEPDDVRAYIEAALRLLDDRYTHRRLADDGARYVRRFSMAEFARRTMEEYYKAIIQNQS